MCFVVRFVTMQIQESAMRCDQPEVTNSNIREVSDIFVTQSVII